MPGKKFDWVDILREIDKRVYLSTRISQKKIAGRPQTILNDISGSTEVECNPLNIIPK